MNSTILIACALLAAAPRPASKPAPKSAVSKPAPAKQPEEAKPAPEPIPTPAPEPAAAAPVPAPAPTPEPPKVAALRVAILDPVVAGEVAPRLLAAFAQSLTPEIRKLEGVSAIGMSEVRDMLAFERQKVLLGCGDDSCLTEIGGALGVDEVVTVQIALLGESWAVTLKRMNTKKAKVLASETRQVARKDGEELLALIGPLVEATFPGRALKPGRARGVDREVARRLNPPPLSRWTFLATGGAALAALAGGSAFGLLSQDARTDFDRTVAAARTVPTDGATVRDLQARVQSRAQTANLLLGVGGALVLAAGIEALFTDWSDSRAALELPKLTALPLATGGLALAGTF